MAVSRKGVVGRPLEADHSACDATNRCPEKRIMAKHRKGQPVTSWVSQLAYWWRNQGACSLKAVARVTSLVFAFFTADFLAPSFALSWKARPLLHPRYGPCRTALTAARRPRRVRRGIGPRWKLSSWRRSPLKQHTCDCRLAESVMKRPRVRASSSPSIRPSGLEGLAFRFASRCSQIPPLRFSAKPDRGLDELASELTILREDKKGSGPRISL